MVYSCVKAYLVTSMCDRRLESSQNQYIICRRTEYMVMYMYTSGHLIPKKQIRSKGQNILESIYPQGLHAENALLRVKVIKQ